MDPEQVDLMIAYLEVEREYGPHGQPWVEATSPAADPNNYETGTYRYVAHHVVDWAQRAINDDVKAVRDAMGRDADISDIRFSVERVDY